MRRTCLRFVAWLSLAAILPVCPVFAAGGPVVLTVAGDIEKSNRGPVDPFVDAFFKYHEISFSSAFEFDRADLQALGIHEMTAVYPGGDRQISVAGPLLKDVLNAAGVKGDSVFATALDGYAAEIPVAELDRYPVILALTLDEQNLGIGARGPTWVVYPTTGHPEISAGDDAKWVWSVFFIRVE